MNSDFPVYTTPNECQDCYKCVRHCISKAIRIVNARAAVIPELCVSCGECVKVCPAHAKKIRSDLSRAQHLVADSVPVYASVAPSFIGYFDKLTIGQLAAGLKKLGFAGVSETALGAQLVSAQVAAALAEMKSGVMISSACPSVVEFITKYHPDWVDAITEVASPVVAHTRLLHSLFGQPAKVVFFGPCAAKKLEADKMPADLALALTFPTLQRWFDDAGINPAALAEEPLTPYAAEEGRAYSLEGGMLDTLRTADPSIRYIAVSGLDDLGRLLSGVNRAELGRGKLFIEALACPGGCVNGPAMRPGASNAATVVNTLGFGNNRTSVGREVPVNIHKGYFRQQLPPDEVTPEQMTEALASVGKFSSEDELNCGGCGYNTCREFARAQIAGRAEPAMCLSYLRKISQKTSNALIKYIPTGVVLADRQLQVIECNRPFAELCGGETLTAFDNCGTLQGALLETMIEFTDLFDEALKSGGEIERLNQVYGNKILNISVFSITPGQTVGAVIQDVTKSELRREQVAEKAREVIRKNVLTVQKIARDLGEHMAETEILLDEVAGIYSEHHLNQPGAPAEK